MSDSFAYGKNYSIKTFKIFIMNDWFSRNVAHLALEHFEQDYAQM